MTQNYQSKKINQQGRKVFWHVTNVQQQKTRPQHVIGAVRRGSNMFKKIKAPKGFHFMGKGKKLRLMKHTGKYKKHKGSSLTANIRLVKKHS